MATLDRLIINMSNQVLSEHLASIQQDIVDALYQGNDTSELDQWHSLYRAERDRRELIK